MIPTTVGTVETHRVEMPCSGDIPPGWVAWDMECGCREAAGPNNETLTVRCAPDCACWQCKNRPVQSLGEGVSGGD